METLHITDKKLIPLNSNSQPEINAVVNLYYLFIPYEYSL